MLTYGIKVAFLGMSTVFVALLILMFLIQAQSNFLAPKPKRKEDPTKEVNSNSNKEQPAAIKTVENDDADEIAAVISAAIAACGHQVVIKTITRISGTNGSPWTISGRTEAMNLRQL